MGPTILFTHLKIILLQCFLFLVFSFKFSATISSIQTDPQSMWPSLQAQKQKNQVPNHNGSSGYYVFLYAA